jgi:3,4-dihydroxy 2-butanone 4-phosphate synthase/GTP cyclohydrolase II
LILSSVASQMFCNSNCAPLALAGQILSDLGIRRIRLLSNTPMHIPALEGFGLEIVEQVAIPVEKCGRAQ